MPTPPTAPRTRRPSATRPRGRGSSCRCPEGRRGSATGRGPRRSRAAAPSPARRCAPAPRTRRACAAAGAARAARSRRHARPRRRRRGRSPAKYARAVRDEVTRLLQQLIRLDTVNPPGNETRAAEHLRGYLEASGVACELYGRDPGRANLVARIPGSGGGPSLCLLSHTDTVLADPSEWRHDPWSGDVVDGEVWGRGALDMKGQVAAGAVAIASLARDGFRPAGDLLFVAAADEEVGDGFGLSWLCRERPDAVRCDYAVNEGSGDRLEFGGRVVYLCSTAEKMTAPFRVRVRGRSGHASMPGIA